MNRLRLCRRRLACLTVLGMLVLMSCPNLSFADEDYGNAKLVISNRPDEYFPELQWQTFDLPVQVVKKGDERRAYVYVRGTLNRTDSDLVYNGKEIPLKENPDETSASFGEWIKLTGKITMMNFHFVDPYGRERTERAVLVFPNWRKFNLPLTVQDKSLRRFLTSLGLGLSYESYSEPGNIQMSELALTPKFNAVYLLKPGQWELGGNTFINALPFANSPSDRAAARWWGINGRVGYRLPIDSIPATNLWIMTGWYVWGMIVDANASSTYGLTYLGGPQVFLTARITPHGKRAAWLYFKFASIENQLTIFSASNRELAVGGGMEVSQRGAKHPVSMTLDYANAQASVTSADANGNPFTQSFNLNSLTLGVSVGL